MLVRLLNPLPSAPIAQRADSAKLFAEHSNAIVLPSGEYVGVAAADFVTTVAPLPSTPTVQTPPAAHVYANRLPSGDHAGQNPSATRLLPDPSAFITLTVFATP